MSFWIKFLISLEILGVQIDGTNTEEYFEIPIRYFAEISFFSEEIFEI